MNRLPDSAPSFSSEGTVSLWEPAPTPPPAPRRIDEYELVGHLGSGAMGVVWAARHRLTGQRVALKQIHAGAGAGPETVERFLTEARAGARLQHPHVVRVLHYGAADGVPYFTMELLPGRSLQDRLARGPLPPAAAARLVRQAAEGIDYAHGQQVLHRDLKPSNLLLTGPGAAEAGADDELAVKVGDFGLARLEDATHHLTRLGDQVGTPSYMAPEQVHGQIQNQTPRTDVYGLGAVLYAALTGRPPFRAANSVATMELVLRGDPEPLRSAAPWVPAALEAVCGKCLEVDPRRRYATAGELAADLGRFLAGKPVLARPIGRPQRVARWVRRNADVAGPAAVVAAALLVAAVVAGYSAVAARAEAARANAAAVAAARAEEQANAAKDSAERQRAAAAAALDSSRLAQASALWDRGEAAKAEALVAAGPSGGVREWEWHHVQGVFDSALWETDLARAGGIDEPQWVYGLEVSPDGERVAVAAKNPYAEGDTSLYLIRAADGRVERVWRNAYPGWCCEMAWQSAGRVVIRSSKQAVLVYDPGSDKPVLTSPPVEHVTRDAHLSPDGAAAVLPVGGTDLIVWDAVRGVAGPRLAVPGRKLNAESIGRGAVVCTDHSSELYCFDAATGALRFSRPGCGGLAAVGPDGRTLVTGRHHADRPRSGTACWDAHTGRLLWERAADRANVSIFQFTPGGRWISDRTYGTSDVRLWAAADGGLGYPLRGHQGKVNATALGPDGRLLATAGDDHAVRLWRVADGSPERVIHGHRSGVRGVGFTRDAAGLVTGGADGRVMLWDLTRQARRHRTVEPARHRRCGPEQFGAMAFTPDGRLRVADTCHGLADYDPATANPLAYRRLGTAHTARLQRDRIDWAMTPDGRRAVGPYRPTEPFLPAAATTALAVTGATAAGLPPVVSRRQGLAAWDGETGAEVWRVAALPGGLTAAAVSPDGARAAAYVVEPRGAAVVVWDLATGRELRREAMPAAGASLAFGPDSRTLFAGPDRGPGEPSLVALDLVAGTRTEWPAAGPLSLRALAFSPDGSLLAGGCRRTGAVVVWDAAPRAVRWRADGSYTHLAFSPDGRRLAGTGYDGTVTLWEAGTGREVYSLTGEPGRIMDYAFPARLAFSRDGRYLAANQHDGTVFVWEADAAPASERRAAAAGAARYLFHLRTAAETTSDARQETAARFHLARLREVAPPSGALGEEYDFLVGATAGRVGMAR
jgi:WD40 repeat protein